MLFVATLSFLTVLYTCDSKVTPLDMDEKVSRQAALPPCPKSCCLKYCPTLSIPQSIETAPQCVAGVSGAPPTCADPSATAKSCNIRSPANVCGPAVCKPKSNCNTHCSAILEIIGITICS